MRGTLLGLLLTGLAYAHPLGNNTVNRQAAIQVLEDAVQIRYLVDLAEIPTLIAAQEADLDGDGRASAGEWQVYAQSYAKTIQAGIELTVSGQILKPTLKQANWRLAPGTAGLSTLRLEAELTAPLARSAKVKIEYRDTRRPEEIGWKEVIADAGEGVRLAAADVPQASSSLDLTAYPELDGKVPNALSATVEAILSPGPPANLAVQKAGRPAISLGSAAETSSAQVLSPLPQALAFFRLGVHHIATGWDHLVFLFGLIVAQTSLRRLALVVTAFTCAHSLTLGLAAFGLARLPGAWVEPAIALTIAYVGLSNLLGKDRHGAALAFAFGLVHGFGFAAALAESLRNTPTGSWLLSLAAFNLGIEAFQLAIVLMLLPLIRVLMLLPLIRKAARLSWGGTARTIASLVVLGAGIGWFFARI